MRTLLVLATLLLVAMQTAWSVERGPAVPDYAADQIAENVYVIHGPIGTPNPDNQGFMNNPGIVLTDAGVVVVDPGGTVQSGEMVLRVIETLTDKPVVAVFNTHVHGDHWLGNQAIRAAYSTAVIYAHPTMLEMVAAGEGETWVNLMMRLTDGKSAGTQVVGPDKVLAHGVEVKIGGHTFRAHDYGPAHTSTDLMIEVVEPAVVFLGDNVLAGRLPRIAEGDIIGNIRACDEMLNVGAQVYVPGHGRSGGRGVVDGMRNYLATLYATVAKYYEQDLSDFEMKPQVASALGEYSNWVSFDLLLGKHISVAYLQIEAAEF